MTCPNLPPRAAVFAAVAIVAFCVSPSVDAQYVPPPVPRPVVTPTPYVPYIPPPTRFSAPTSTPHVVQPEARSPSGAVERSRPRKTARPELDEACDAGDGAVCLAVGLRLKDSSRYMDVQGRALAHFRAGCDLKVSEACRWAGILCEAGVSEPRHPACHAFLHFIAACQGGDAEGCKRLGTPRPGTVPPAELVQVMTSACNKDYWPGCNALVDHLVGRYDFEGAVRVLERTCQASHRPSCERLLELQRQGRWKAASPARVAELLERTCRMGNNDDCAAAAQAYATGAGLTRDEKKAAELARSACAGGNADGCLLQARTSAAGGGASPAATLAAYEALCGKTEETKVRATACLEAGLAYAAGRGVARSAARAHGLFVKGCPSRPYAPFAERACTEAGIDFEKGRGVKADPVAALRHYQGGSGPEACAGTRRLAAKLFARRQPDAVDHYCGHCAFGEQSCDKTGMAESCVRCAEARLTGSPGVPRDPADARANFEKACRLGHRPSCKRAK